MEAESELCIVSDSLEFWTLEVDGSSNSKGSGARILLKSQEGFKIEQAIHFDFRATNNEVEYEALIAGLQLCVGLRIKKLKVQWDSQLIINQSSGEFQAKDFRMAAYRDSQKTRAPI